MSSPTAAHSCLREIEAPRRRLPRLEHLLFLLAASVIASPVQALEPLAPPPGVQAMLTDADKDAAYAFHVRDGSRYEIAASRMALQRSRDDRIRAFAQMMINDHTRMLDNLPSGRGGSRDLSEPKDQMLETLRLSSDETFDEAYVRGQVAVHEEAVEMHRLYAARAGDQALRQFARQASAVDEAHLERARALRPASRYGGYRLNRLAVASRACLSPRASAAASALAQKCRKKRRGSSPVMWL